MPPTNPQNRRSLTARVDDHESRLDALEARMAKYDTIIAKLDTLIDVLTRRVEATADKAEDAIEGQQLIKERNESAYRWSAVSIAVATSLVVGVLCFILGYVIR